MLSVLLLAAIAMRAEPAALATQKGGGRQPIPADPKGGAGSTGSKGSDAASANLQLRYFAICDRDGDRSISYPEARESLSLDRKGFSVYDVDGDGLISLPEFRRRYKEILEAGGTFPPPKAKVVPPSALPATAEKVLELFDKDRDGSLALAELDAALVGMGASKIDPETALSQFDHDGSGSLEPAEIEELLSLLRTGSTRRPGPKPKSVSELFGKVIQRKDSATSATEPPRLLGPVPSFRRLDIDGDGRITRDELVELQRPYSLSVQARAVLAALDADGDGVVSEAEFWSAMGAAR